MRLEGNKVVLRDEPKPGDLDDLFRWINREDLAYLDHPDRPFAPVSREEFDERSRAREAPHTASVWRSLQMDTPGGEHIGWINCYDLDEEVQGTSVGICLARPGHRGKGLGSEALRLLLGYLFKKRGLAEVYITTWTGNGPMVGCARKAGFREVSRSPHRAPVSVRGEPLERIDFAVSRREWESHAERRPRDSSVERSR